MTQSPDITKIPSDRLFISYHWSDLAARQKIRPLLLRQKAKPPVAPPPDGLLTRAEAARRLRCSEKTLRAHLDAGDLRYVSIGKGTKRPRKMIAPADLDDFIANQTRKDSPVCRYIASRARCSSTSNSASEVIAFTGQPRPRPGAKPKKSGRASARRRNSAELRSRPPARRYGSMMSLGGCGKRTVSHSRSAAKPGSGAG